MKFWTKVLILGTASFILLTGVAFLLANSVSEDANQLESEGSSTNGVEMTYKKHNP